jgi:carboxypeptidase C (cathepsin A)
MRANPSLRVLIGCGIYDLVCDYFGNVWRASHLDASLARNVVARSYPGGHAMYTDPRAHLELKRDVVQFIRDAVALSARPR